jgi:hypothetical protein
MVKFRQDGAVHSVLTKEKNAPEVAAALESELVRIIGFVSEHRKSDQYTREWKSLVTVNSTMF